MVYVLSKVNPLILFTELTGYCRRNQKYMNTMRRKIYKFLMPEYVVRMITAKFDMVKQILKKCYTIKIISVVEYN